MYERPYSCTHSCADTFTNARAVAATHATAFPTTVAFAVVCALAAADLAAKCHAFASAHLSAFVLANETPHPCTEPITHAAALFPANFTAVICTHTSAHA
jgi:hypothetical protein